MLVLAIPFDIDHDVMYRAMEYYPNLHSIALIANYIGGLLLVLGYRFPDGQFILRWLRWFAGVWIIVQSGFYFLKNTAFNLYNLPPPWSNLINPLFAISVIYAMVYRYQHITDQTQKQQIKWVVFSGSILAVIGSISSLWEIIDAVMPLDIKLNYLFTLIYDPLLWLSSLFVAVSLGLSILRYRLWDIDFLVNRSLVYGALTVLLALVFGGSLFLVSRIVEGQNFVLASGITAVIAGSSFKPTRRRIQRFVDQRFYNITIDCQKTPLDIPSSGATQVLRTTQFGLYKDLELIGARSMSSICLPEKWCAWVRKS